MCTASPSGSCCCATSVGRSTSLLDLCFLGQLPVHDDLQVGVGLEQPGHVVQSGVLDTEGELEEDYIINC